MKTLLNIIVLITGAVVLISMLSGSDDENSGDKQAAPHVQSDAKIRCDRFDIQS